MHFLDIAIFAVYIILLATGKDSAGIDTEICLPMLIRTVLPAGLMGLMMSTYFSAILSTADKCLGSIR
jgi:Na+/proline symporter